MSDPKKAPEMFDGPLGILPDGKLNTVSLDAPPFEPTIVDDDEPNDGAEVSDEELEAMLAEPPIDE